MLTNMKTLLGGRPPAVVSANLDALVAALAGNSPDTDQEVAITEIAQAQLELLRIRKVRAQMLAAAELEQGDLKVLQRLLASWPTLRGEERPARCSRSVVARFQD